MIAAGLTGFATGFSLIVAIGAQNAFVLRQGLLRHHVFAVCLICAVSDAVLIAAGVAGFGLITENFPQLPRYLSWGGAGFLAFYGALRLMSAWRGGAGLAEGADTPSFRRTVAEALAFTWLNPHVWLDTIGLNGAVSTAYDGAAKWAFGLGSTWASFVFFFALGYGARLLAPLMRRPGTWRVLDAGIGLLMWGLAAGLLSAF
jgi:L-lysine exporter family protein LysE/ArgO